MVTTDKYVFFWGDWTSNFAPCTIKMGSLVFHSSEQFFMYHKAIYFHDYVTAEEILNADTPRKAKGLGRKVKGFDDEEWAKIRYEVMFNACYEKFSQNENFKKKLLSEKYIGKHFVEASPEDRIWGIGLYETEASEENKDMWGLNLLGKILDGVRERLFKENSQNIAIFS